MSKTTRACWFWVDSSKPWIRGEWHGWTSQAWGMTPEPAAIVEDETGKVHVVPATQVHFGTVPS